MKTCLKLIPLAALALLMASPTMQAASDGNPPPAAEKGRPRLQEMRARRLQELDEKLGLTADQKAKINAIWDEAEKAAQENRNDSDLARRERREKQREMMAATHRKVREVLTDEQRKIFDEMPRGRPGRPPGPPRG